MDLIQRINAQLAAHSAPPLTADMVSCIEDRSRLRQAAELLEKLCRSHAFLIPFNPGKEFGPFDQAAAYEVAEEQSRVFDAVAVDEMATDDGRSYGGNEFYVTGFNGSDAVLAAICRSSTGAYWVAGTLVEE